MQLSVLDRSRTTPPVSRADGDRHLVASGAVGLWAGWDLNVAFWVDGVWLRLVPRHVWLVWIAAEQVFQVWNGTVWDPVGVPQDVSDSIFSLVNDADPTKKALFSLSGITTGTTRTFNQSAMIALHGKIGNAFIAWARHGKGSHVDRETGLSRIDLDNDRDRRPAEQARLAMERAAKGGPA